ncbi:HK97-gp10 family putative phage morphogenesis protein [Mesorhizobium sp.]|uniref:HK97-gp10 family putative phage morphogenesis protein n=1 Tax=Mesorhizobium sp. TaxID=1871066 RepID=UPI0025BE95C4|nr:HK97-gp10 family putative phage morphogenesis protein [Mesorhizobium sp.]
MNKKLRAMPAAVRVAGRAAMEKGAEEIVGMAKRLCPVDDGDLRDSIGWTWSDAPNGSLVLAQSVPTIAGNERIVIYAGNNRAFYATFVEFGTVKMAKRSFFFPAYRSLKKRTLDRIKRSTRAALKNGGVSTAEAA